MSQATKLKEKLSGFCRLVYSRALYFLLTEVYFGKNPASVPDNSVVFFPQSENILFCGFAGIVSFKTNKQTGDCVDIALLEDMVKKVESCGYNDCIKNKHVLDSDYLGGEKHIASLVKLVKSLREQNLFYDIVINEPIQNSLSKLADQLSCVIDTESKALAENMGLLDSRAVNIMSRSIESLRDIEWSITREITGNIQKIKELIPVAPELPAVSSFIVYKKINAVLNSIDRLEVRGRDSAGVSLMFILGGDEFKHFNEEIGKTGLYDRLRERSDQNVLVNNSISIHENVTANGKKNVAIAFTYKIAAEVGNLGDNIKFLRQQITGDLILHKLISFPHLYNTVLSHTRWASMGVISEPNCHPVDNKTLNNPAGERGIIHVCLNGDIDNYMDLKSKHEAEGGLIHKDITTDTKIIPLWINRYIQQGFDVEESFRLAVCDFEGSHAICMHTDLAPGKLFLAQKGSGQTIFIGMANDFYMPTSEVYGFIEETSDYIKMDGENGLNGVNGKTNGQIIILDQESAGSLDGIKAMFYDGTGVDLEEKEIKHSDITSRDIDRQGFSHYFLKEIMESPDSVEKTLRNRWKIKDKDGRRYEITLEKSVLPQSTQKALANNKIKRIFFVGQGTAGVAAIVCADILNYYLEDQSLLISAMKASELSGFKLNDHDDAVIMEDTLVVAITQSGTTTDTNCAMDMVKQRGAHTLAIVNRRDSDITFKVDGVMYTSTGRDIEMSVASTKAFYSQIVAGAILGLYIASLKGRRNDAFVTEEIKQLTDLPSCMREVLAMRERIGMSAQRLAVKKTHWAAVGSGPNKAAADEIRIKLSELCYKTISSDFVEDKKHIDLSSEPLIIVCAAGTGGGVLGDIVKDVAIFQSHKATSVVIADEGENRFDLYAADVFHVPKVSRHLAPIVNTLAGHIWGYYAALAINESSKLMYNFNKEIQSLIDDHAAKGMDVYEVILEKSFRERIAQFYTEFRKKLKNSFPYAMGFESASDLILLLKYLSGRLPVSDFELDFGIKGTPLNMLNKLFRCLGDSINSMARPVDAIKHQAKTVTVGTSRISERIEGILFEAITKQHLNLSQLINKNIVVLKNLQDIVAGIEGSILYRISGQNLLGEPTDETTIEITNKQGTLCDIPSRVEKDIILKGTKRIIVREGNVYIGIGRQDDRSVIIIPVISSFRATPNMIEHLLLLHISFKENVSISTKIKALGGKYERIKNIVQENSVAWDKQHIELVDMRDLFGLSAEKIGEFIVSSLKKDITMA
ncbi:MAG: SIS domain-containing protein [Desulfobacteraceae bacterium]|uniref:Glutamine--fructose-6-phosphate aminotransferase [isomerizing] n=1 Tax=Candidatus Desulfaltia bathyphila TaxID=2841697 RepID=A0A8J6N2W6_9BACT|nr:SIS domain-containing protein [Candidatus Desulfaltia bathyphila]